MRGVEGCAFQEQLRLITLVPSACLEWVLHIAFCSMATPPVCVYVSVLAGAVDASVSVLGPTDCSAQALCPFAGSCTRTGSSLRTSGTSTTSTRQCTSGSQDSSSSVNEDKGLAR